MKRLIYLCALTTTMSIFSCSGNAPKNAEPKHWLATWGTAVQLTEPHNMPPAPGLSGNTIRQRVKVTLGGDSLRLKLSNEFGDAPLKISAVSIANSIDSCAIDPASATNVLFGNKPSLEIPKTLQKNSLVTRVRAPHRLLWKATISTMQISVIQLKPTIGTQLSVSTFSPLLKIALWLSLATQSPTVAALPPI